MNKIYVPTEKVLMGMKLPDLDKLYWSLFSRWIRLKAADIYTGYVSCFICGRRQHWTQMDCSHYIPRKHGSTRFSLLNNHACCQWCNRGLAGNLKRYREKLNLAYGKGTSRKLEQMKNLTIKISRLDYVEGILDVQKKLELYERKT